MRDIIRDSALGHLIRFATRNKVLLYPEEKLDFILPRSLCETSIHQPITLAVNSNTPASGNSAVGDNRLSSDVESQVIDTDQYTQDQLASTYNDTHEIKPIVTKDGKILVTWYTSDDSENPQNWSSKKKLWIACVINMYSFTVYLGSSIYSPGVPQMVAQFGVSEIVGSLGLALYVLAFLGRTHIYVTTFIIYVILCIPESLVNNIGAILVIRFLLGFFGSPCLATGAASFQDMYDMMFMTYSLAFWAGAVTLGPALAPIIAGFSVSHENWHWMGWEMLWLSGPVCIAMFVLLPETSADTILLRRARRLRKLTGRDDLYSQSEIDQAHMSAREIVVNALFRPWEINILDPAVLFTTIYVALVYGIFYSFLECFPLVYPIIYNFNLGESNLPFLTVIVALLIGMPVYMGYFKFVVRRRVVKTGWGMPEDRLYIALYVSWLIPVGLFLFAWTTRPDVHWIVSCIGLTLTMWGEYTIMQCVFMYLPFTYPKYAASLFAANDFARSAFAAGCIIFSQPMYRNLGVAKGVTLLAGLTVGCTCGLYILYWQGANLRARSKFASK
ncbi:major facilitator superfamily domain-containing protein [Trichoderma velutinum]